MLNESSIYKDHNNFKVNTSILVTYQKVTDIKLIDLTKFKERSFDLSNKKWEYL